MEGDCRKSCQNKYIAYFNPLPPHGGRLVFSLPGADLGSISIHSLRMEGDNVCDCPVCIHCISIHSLRMEGDSENLFAAVCRNDISIHSLRMEGDHFIGCAVCIDCISIHSLRMEGDGRGSPGIPVPHWISIHSLRMEGDPDGLHLPRSIRNFNPLPPHGGRR